MRLAGKRAIVTGSSSGIGRGIALALAAEGAKLVINARGSGTSGTAAIDDVVAEIRSVGGTAIGVAGAVNDPAFAERLVGACTETYDGIDILINNAAILNLDPVTECGIDRWREIIDVNLNGVFYVTRAALPHMVRQQWGRVITASSLAGSGVIGGSAYTASKAALLGLSRALAADYGPYGITSNVYCPEAKTPMGDTIDDEVFVGMHRRFVDRGYETEAEFAYRVGIGGPEGVAPWITYLCLDEADYLNGQAFAVEARRVALLASPDETKALYRDASRNGVWNLQELGLMAPFVFPVRNAWPRRTGADLAAWEARLLALAVE